MHDTKINERLRRLATDLAKHRVQTKERLRRKDEKLKELEERVVEQGKRLVDLEVAKDLREEREDEEAAEAQERPFRPKIHLKDEEKFHLGHALYIAALQQERDQLNRDKRELEAARNSAWAKIRDMKEERRGLRAAMVEKEAELRSLQNSRYSQRKHLQDEIDDLTEAHQELVNENAELKRRLREREDQIFATAKKRADRQLVQLREENQGLREELETLRQQLYRAHDHAQEIVRITEEE